MSLTLGVAAEPSQDFRLQMGQEGQDQNQPLGRIQARFQNQCAIILGRIRRRDFFLFLLTLVQAHFYQSVA